jgi:uncharacterized protein YqjF (DUF2071 family)
MERSLRPFLTARWLNLAIVNFEIDAAVLAPYVPAGTELDDWQGQTLVSLVGFQFHDIRVLGVGVPFHRRFDEVNLRFYVRRPTINGWRRGVVFVREVAPRRAVAWVARWLYGENYVPAPLRHRLEFSSNGEDNRVFEYGWRFRGGDYRLQAAARGRGAPATAGSEAEFLIEQYWGYSGRAGRKTIEYRVEHRPWNLSKCSMASFDGDVAWLYGPKFVEALAAPPVSGYVADGSSVSVFRGVPLAEPGPRSHDAVVPHTSVLAARNLSREPDIR